MLTLPHTLNALVLRTDFSDAVTWDAITAACGEPSPEGFGAGLSFVSDPAFAGVGTGQVVGMPGAADRGFLFLVDSVTITHPEMPLLAVDLRHEPGRSFRVVPTKMWSVENNLSMSNMDFFEFANNVDPDGVFRGFPICPPLTPAEEEEKRTVEERELYGDRVPNERLRAVGGLYAKTLAQLDIDLTFALAETGDAVHRAVAAWAAVRALEHAGLVDLPAIAPAMAALRRGGQAPPPFDNPGIVWSILNDAPVARTSVPVPPDGAREQSPQDWAITTVFHSANADSLTAVLDILVALAFVYGRDGYREAFGSVRSTFPQLNG
jgi:hypothetical protein